MEKKLILVVLPRVSGTAVTLGAGLLLGVVFGALTKVGLPVVVGAVFTLGLAYSVAGEVKGGNISSYVGMVAGLEMFDRIERLTLFGDEWLQDLAGPRRPTAVRHVLGPAHRLAGGHCGGCYNQAVFAQGGIPDFKKLRL